MCTILNGNTPYIDYRNMWTHLSSNLFLSPYFVETLSPHANNKKWFRPSWCERPAQPWLHGPTSVADLGNDPAGWMEANLQLHFLWKAWNQESGGCLWQQDAPNKCLITKYVGVIFTHSRPYSVWQRMSLWFLPFFSQNTIRVKWKKKNQGAAERKAACTAGSS